MGTHYKIKKTCHDYNNATSESLSSDCKTPSAILLKAPKPPFFIQISWDIQMKKKVVKMAQGKKSADNEVYLYKSLFVPQTAKKR